MADQAFWVQAGDLHGICLGNILARGSFSLRVRASATAYWHHHYYFAEEGPARSVYAGHPGWPLPLDAGRPQ